MARETELDREELQKIHAINTTYEENDGYDTN